MKNRDKDGDLQHTMQEWKYGNSLVDVRYKFSPV
jgi:hypothetical protein